MLIAPDSDRGYNECHSLFTGFAVTMIIWKNQCTTKPVITIKINSQIVKKIRLFRFFNNTMGEGSREQGTGKNFLFYVSWKSFCFFELFKFKTICMRKLIFLLIINLFCFNTFSQQVEWANFFSLNNNPTCIKQNFEF